MSILLDGFTLASSIRSRLKADVDAVVSRGQRRPGLSVIVVGSDFASLTYVKSKEKQANSVGFVSDVVRLPETVSQETLLKAIATLNNNTRVDGILLQLPLPKHLDEDQAIASIAPTKDVDGLTPDNVAALTLGKEGLVACTPKGIMSLLDAYNIDVEGKKVLIIGRSRLVGRPLASLMLKKNATVTIAHSKTKNLEQECLNHEIIVVATGQKGLIKPSYIKDTHVLVDVGIHRNEDGSLSGDVDKVAYERAAFATPVPKGVGPMTIVSLLENTMIAYNQGEIHE